MYPSSRRHIARCALILFVVIGWGSGVSAQTRPAYVDYARPGLNWYTLETEHFKVHFHGETERASSSRTAQVVARVAEDIYEPITDLYEHEPDGKVAIVLMDFFDYSNGAAYFFDNMIDIWVPYLDSNLRGDHNWLRNVITHEFTHIVQLQTAMKAHRRWPFTYLQYFSYEDVRRPDVLYGYPDGLVSYPVPTLNNPAWFAEGTAQYQRASVRYDTWDSHRDMLLRTQVLDDRTLDLSEMGGFYSDNSLERESVYNHGYAFTRFLAGTYGEDVLRTISRELSEWDNWNISQALHEAVGEPADRIFSNWKEALADGYTRETEQLRRHEKGGELLESDGFLNLHPQFSPDGGRVAYLSNKGEDYSTLSLYIRDVASGETTSLPIDVPHRFEAGYTCAFGHAVVRGVTGSFDWHPEADRVLYTRISDTPEGFRYADIYEMNLETEEIQRLTHNRRASAPVYAPDGSSIVFVGQRDGTTNLYLLDRDSEDILQLTRLAGGAQATDPEWHPDGEWIYFARTTGEPRDIYRIRPDGSQLQAVEATRADERSPTFDPSGERLYFSSDRSGIFNIYRRSVNEPDAQPLTNVLGGAFMPSVGPNGNLVFARYDAAGYKVARLTASRIAHVPDEWMTYSIPDVVQDKGGMAETRYRSHVLNAFDDTDIEPLGSHFPGQEHGTEYLSANGASDETGAADTLEYEISPYEESFTSFSVYPVLRIDQYAKQATGLGSRILRNTKGGAYFNSREILDRMRLFGGLTLGWASEEARSVPNFFAPSRLLRLERDAFLQFDYLAGLPFISKRWSPQFSVQLYNTRRNVDAGMTIEEFPCTACYPDTTHADVAYGLWQADFLMRSKLTQWALVELGYRYSPYRVRTEPFYSKEHQQTIPATSDRYFIGRAFTATGYFEMFHRYRHSDVLREGWRLAAGYEYQPSRLLDQFDIEDGALVPEYQQYNNHRLWWQSYLGMRLPGTLGGGPHGISARLHGSTIVGPPVDDFFDSYVGGLTGARGYPFYALGGNETLWVQLAYHFPLVPSIGKQLLFLYADKLYAKVYADAAMAWDGGWPGLNAVRKDVGAELRLGLGSFYLLPTSIFISSTYSLDSFDAALSEGFVTPEGSRSVRYGNEWLWHFGVLFDFDFDI